MARPTAAMNQSANMHIILLYEVLYPTAPDVSLPMNDIIGNVLTGSLSGTTTGGVVLVPGQLGYGIYFSNEDSRVVFDINQSNCCYDPDFCPQGVTFAMWMKRDQGAGDGFILNTGGSELNARGDWEIQWNIKHVHITNKMWATAINSNSMQINVISLFYSFTITLS